MIKRINVNEGRQGYMMLHLTLGCNAKCAHCAFMCCPERRDLRLSAEEVGLAIDIARRHNFEQVTLTGGEPALALDLVEFGLREAKRAAISVGIETNCSWAKTSSIARDILRRWASYGVVRWIFPSYDSYHSKFIKPQCVINVCEQAESLGFRVEIRVTEVPGGKRQRTMDKLTSVSRFIPEDGFNFPSGVGRGSGLASTELNLPSFAPLLCTHYYYQHTLISIFPQQLVSFNCEYANPRLTYRYPVKDNWLVDMMDIWNDDNCIIDMWDKGLSGISKIYNVVNGHPCEYCFGLLPALYPDKELIDVRGIKH